MVLVMLAGEGEKKRMTEIPLTRHLTVRTGPIRVGLGQGRKIAFHATDLGADLERGAVDRLIATGSCQWKLP